MSNKINITFPDGNSKEYNKNVTGYEVAYDISPSLAKQAVLIEINGDIKDLHSIIEHDSVLKIIKKDSDSVLDVLRHDCAHVMAEAVQELFPDTQVTIGPSIENGFYYDFARKQPFTTDDFKSIENKMHEIINKGSEFRKEVWTREKAIDFFKQKENFIK